MKKLFGVTVALITPMDADGMFDPEAMRRLTSILIKKGVNCLYPCGTTGEMNKLSLKERKKVAETVISEVNHRVTVFIHVGAEAETKTLKLAKHAYEIGADGIGIITPRFLGCNNREITGYYMRIAKELPNKFPIYLYNIPQYTASDLTYEAVIDIYNNNENVIGIKYSYTDFNRTLEYLKVSPNFSVLHGCDKLFSSFLVLGCNGTVSGVAGVFPEPFIKVYENFLLSDIAEMQKWQRIGVEICDILKCGKNMAYFKKALSYRGISAGHMRLPQLDLCEEEKIKLVEQLDEFCKRNGIRKDICIP